MHNFNHTMYRHRTQIDRGHHIYFISFSPCVIQLNDAKRRWMRANRESRDKYSHSTALKRKSREWKKVKSIFSRTYIGISTRSLRCARARNQNRISWTEKIEIPSVRCVSVCVLWVRLCVRACSTEWIALQKCSAIAKRGNQDSNIRHRMRNADRIVLSSSETKCWGNVFTLRVVRKFGCALYCSFFLEPDRHISHGILSYSFHYLSFSPCMWLSVLFLPRAHRNSVSLSLSSALFAGTASALQFEVNGIH